MVVAAIVASDGVIDGFGNELKGGADVGEGGFGKEFGDGGSDGGSGVGAEGSVGFGNFMFVELKEFAEFAGLTEIVGAGAGFGIAFVITGCEEETGLAGGFGTSGGKGVEESGLPVGDEGVGNGDTEVGGAEGKLGRGKTGFNCGVVAGGANGWAGVFASVIDTFYAQSQA